jgi:N-acetylglutamate synthase-like GNAT family acetyltransferase
MEVSLPPEYQLRRATVDDLPQLRELWIAAGLDAVEMERRFTEFQVAVDPEGVIAGATALHIEKQQGEIHSELLRSPDLAYVLRPLLWERLKTVAKNHGLLRIWALATTSFIREMGMKDPDPQTLAKLPTSFGHPQAGWVTMKLKEEVLASSTIEQELALLAQAQKAETDALLRRAQFVRAFAYILLTLACIALAVIGWITFRKLPKQRIGFSRQP